MGGGGGKGGPLQLPPQVLNVQTMIRAAHTQLFAFAKS